MNATEIATPFSVLEAALGNVSLLLQAIENRAFAEHDDAPLIAQIQAARALAEQALAEAEGIL